MAGTKDLIARLRRNFSDSIKEVTNSDMEIDFAVGAFNRAAVDTLAEILDGGETSTPSTPRKNKGGRKKGSKNKPPENQPETGDQD